MDFPISRKHRRLVLEIKDSTDNYSNYSNNSSLRKKKLTKRKPLSYPTLKNVVNMGCCSFF